MKAGHDLKTARQWALQRIYDTRVAGQGTRHDRADNIKAIERFVAGVPHYTFGMTNLKKTSPTEVLEMVAEITGCSHNLAYKEGAGYISPQQTLVGLEMATKAMVETAHRRGRFVLGTGHPGSLLQYYIELGRLIRSWGGEIVEVGQGTLIPPNFELDFIEGVAVISDRASLWHTHDPIAMQEILKLDRAIDMAVVDHGFAGGAIMAGVPSVTIMDTNDPAPAVAKRQGADVIIIPMDDNRLPSVYLPIVNTIRDLAPMLGAPALPVEEAIRPEVALHFSSVERLVRERLNGTEAARQLIEGFADSFSDQFVQTRLRREGHESEPDDAFAVIAAYGILRKLFDQFIIGEMHYRQPELTPEEIGWYFRRYSALDPCRNHHAESDEVPQPNGQSKKPRRNGGTT